MKHWQRVIFTVAALSVAVDTIAAPIKPVSDNPLQAQTSLGFNVKTKCPDLRMADVGARAVVVFWVPGRGKPSQISLKTSSGSDDLDSAAISCVSKLRFAAATTLGDGEPVDSWQQFALSWADPAKAYDARTASAQMPVDLRQAASAGQGGSVTVHVCVDDKGKLEREPAIIQSSGVAALDQAAVKIAAAGSAYYRPRTASSGQSASSCAQLAIAFDTK